MKEPRRIYAWDLAHQIGLGPDAPIVVCACCEPERCGRLKIEGSLSLKEFESRLDSIPTGKEIVFFCSSPQDAVAIERGAHYQAKGFTRVRVLSGGIEAWNTISAFRTQLESRKERDTEPSAPPKKHG